MEESVLAKADSRPDTDSRSVDGRARAVRPRWQHLPYGVVLAGVLAGLGWMWLGATRQVKPGMLTVAAALLLAAVLRLVLPESRAGLLVSRHRLNDVLVLAFLGAAMLAVVLVLPKGA
jgi:zinc transporter ZupT